MTKYLLALLCLTLTMATHGEINNVEVKSKAITSLAKAEKACNDGNGDACLSIGFTYYNGKAVKRNFSQSYL